MRRRPLIYVVVSPLLPFFHSTHNSVRVAIMHKMCSVFRKSACMFGGIPLWTLPVQIESVLWSRANRSACVADSYNAYIPL